jgi:alpha-tubulin suppressor-like RCC1 family protein
MVRVCVRVKINSNFENISNSTMINSKSFYSILPAMLPEPYPTECYCWGSGAGGALGETVKVQLTPKRFDLPRKHIANVFAGDRRTIAQTSNGDAYSWGSDPLGRKCTASNKAVAKKLKSISSLVKFSHGDTHSVAIDINGRAFSFGDAAYGKLGLNRRRKVELPTVIHLGGKCIDISCGESDFSFIITDDASLTNLTLPTRLILSSLIKAYLSLLYYSTVGKL